MTISFFKLHVAGNDFILVDRDRREHGDLKNKGDALPALAAAMADRGRGVGARGVLFVSCSAGRDPQTLQVRAFDPSGAERRSGGDALLCVARWASDSGKAAGGTVIIADQAGERTLSAMDSRNFVVEMPAPISDKPARLDLILDGLQETAYLLKGDILWAATIGREGGPAPRRVRAALASAAPQAVPVISRPAGRDLIRFSTVDGADRVGAAAAAAAAGKLCGAIDDSVVAEWRGKGAAVPYADFGPAGSRRAAATAGAGALIDRGRFYVDWKKPERILVAGIAEYTFEGSFDFFA